MNVNKLFEKNYGNILIGQHNNFTNFTTPLILVPDKTIVLNKTIVPTKESFGFARDMYCSQQIYENEGYYTSVEDFLNEVTSDMPEKIPNLFIVPDNLPNDMSLCDLFKYSYPSSNNDNHNDNDDNNINDSSNFGAGFAYLMRKGFFGDDYNQSPILVYGDLDDGIQKSLEEISVDTLTTKIDFNQININNNSDSKMYSQLKKIQNEYRDMIQVGPNNNPDEYELVNKFKQFVLDHGIISYIQQKSTFLID